MAEESALTANTINQKKSSRNYQLDFFKLVFTFFVFICHSHSRLLKGVNTNIILPPALGTLSVHFFFIVSGMLMVNSIMKNDDIIEYPGKSAIQFVLKKFKSISIQYWVALFLYILIFFSINNFENISLNLSKIFPELFLVTNSGVLFEYNGPAWYISAMFIVMLPLAYLMYKNKDLFMNVLAPLIAVLSLGYWCQIHNYALSDDRMALFGIVIGGVIRALCGLCFGVVAWQIYNKLCQMIKKKSQRILITVLEVFLWTVFFLTWFVLRDQKAIYSVLFILPIAIAITFSKQSYISRLFEFKWMKVFGPFSLAVYLNHWIALRIVQKYYPKNYPNYSNRNGVLLMIGITLMLCLIYFLLIYLIKQLWNKKLKKVFSNQEEQ